MFGTLRLDSPNNEFVDLTSEFLSNDTDTYAAPHFACDACRMKKIKCNGQKTGCDRCKVTSTPCVYASTGDATGGRRRRCGEDRSSAKNQRLISPSQTNSMSGFRNFMSPQKTTPPNHIETEEVDDLAMDDPPLRTFEEFLVSDQYLLDMLPSFGSQRSEDSIQHSESLSHVNLNGSCRLTSGPSITEPITASESPVRMNSPSRVMRKSDMPVHSHFTPFSSPISMHSEMPPPEQPAYRDKGLHSLPTMPPTPTTPMVQTVQDPKNIKSSHDPSASCRCLQTIISLLQKLENNSNSIESSTLDSVLAFYKETLPQCKPLLQCVGCTARSENFMLFILSEKLVDFCERIVNEYLSRPRGRSDLLIQNNSGEASVSMPRRQNLSIGRYEVDSPIELDFLFKVLIGLQLKALEELLIEFRKIFSSSLHGATVSKIFNSEQKLERLAKKLQRS